FSPKYGHPFSQVTGDNDVSRPTELWSCMAKPHHSPVCVCTIPPWCRSRSLFGLGSGGLFSIGGVFLRPPFGRYPCPIPRLSSALIVSTSHGPVRLSARAHFIGT